MSNVDVIEPETKSLTLITRNNSKKSIKNRHDYVVTEIKQIRNEDKR